MLAGCEALPPPAVVNFAQLLSEPRQLGTRPSETRHLQRRSRASAARLPIRGAERADVAEQLQLRVPRGGGDDKPASVSGRKELSAPKARQTDQGPCQVFERLLQDVDGRRRFREVLAATRRETGTFDLWCVQWFGCGSISWLNTPQGRPPPLQSPDGGAQDDIRAPHSLWRVFVWC